MAEPDPKTAAAVLALVKAQSAAREQLVYVTQATVAAEVRAFTGWYDHTAIAKWAARLAKLTNAAQKQTAAGTDSFAVRVLRLLTGKSVAAVGPVPVKDLRGVPLEAVYGRLADQYRFLEATRGENTPQALLERPGRAPAARLSPDERVARLVIRSSVQVDDNLSLAFQKQWEADMAEAAADVIGYRRVLHPELSVSGVCGLCLVASDRLYSRGDLLPIHGRCRCSVLPVIGDEDGTVRFDPGADLNAADLKLIYQKAGGTTAGRELKKARFSVVQHQELGPRLTYAGHHHKSYAEAAADTTSAPAA